MTGKRINKDGTKGNRRKTILPWPWDTLRKKGDYMVLEANSKEIIKRMRASVLRYGARVGVKFTTHEIQGGIEVLRLE